ncbi:MAG: SDR family oxidoreductase, partial [Monoglobaceae bacterium]
QMTEEDFDSVLDVNLKGAFNMIKHCYRNFMKKKYGKIINLSSVSGIIGNPGQANYSSSKAGIIGLTKTVAKELAGRNVCCNAIAPGFIETDMTEAFKENEAVINNIPMKKMGSPEDVANLAAFLADSASDYITGEVIRVDGGLAI